MQKTAYEMRSSDWSSDVCSSDLITPSKAFMPVAQKLDEALKKKDTAALQAAIAEGQARSEEHTSELQSLMRISYAVFCLKKKKKRQHTNTTEYNHTTHTSRIAHQQTTIATPTHILITKQS